MTNYSDFTLSGLIPADAVPAESTAPCLAVSHTPAEHPPTSIISKTTTISLINPPDGKNTPHPGGSQTKVCPKCGVEKELTGEEWYKRPDRKSGYELSACRTCIYQRIKAWKEANVEKVRKAARDYARRRYADNPQKYLDRQAAYRELHPDAVKKSQKKYHKAHLKERYEYKEKWIKAHPGSKQLYDRKYYLSHRLDRIRKSCARQAINIAELKDTYIKKSLRESGINVTPDQIERKRQAIQLHRTIRRINGEIRESKSAA